jgi:hypothetical protein
MQGRQRQAHRKPAEATTDALEQMRHCSPVGDLLVAVEMKLSSVTTVLLLVFVTGCNSKPKVQPAKSADGGSEETVARSSVHAQSGLDPSYACQQPDAPPGGPDAWANMKNKASPGVLPVDYEWGCLAGYAELPVQTGEPLRNRVLVFAFGTPSAAKVMRVELAVNTPARAAEARAQMAARVATLVEQLRAAKLPKDVLDALQSADSGSWTLGKLPAALTRLPLPPGGAEGGYLLRFDLDVSQLRADN